jgi:hypothetical protein
MMIPPMMIPWAIAGLFCVRAGHYRKQPQELNAQSILLPRRTYENVPTILASVPSPCLGKVPATRRERQGLHSALGYKTPAASKTN